MRRRLIVPGLLGLLLLVALGYGLYWHFAAQALEQGIARWAAERRAEGYRVAYAGPSIGGFPFRLEARLEEPAIEAPPAAGGWRWRGPAIRGEAAPWRPLRIDFSVPGRHELSREVAGQRLVLEVDAGTADGTVEIAPDGRLESFDAMLADLAIGDAPDRRIAVAAATVAATLPKPSATDHRRSSVAFGLSIDGLVLPTGESPPLGRRIQHIAADGALMGRIPPGPPERALRRWLDDGGTLELHRLSIDWGPFHLVGDGTFALDQAMRPLAAMSATISGHAETLDVLVAEGVVQPREGSIARRLLAAMSRTPEDGGPPRLEVALTAQDGYLHVGPVKLIPLPAIGWP